MLSLQFDCSGDYRQTALELGLLPSNRYGGSRAWTADELATLGTIPDEMLANKLV
jgi:hypothetical protein